MPNLTDFGWTEGAAAQVTVPAVTITAKVYDDDNPPALVADYTGPAAIHFPDCMAALSQAQRAEVLDLIAQMLVLRKAGY